MATSKLGWGLFGASLLVAAGCDPPEKVRTLRRQTSFLSDEVADFRSSHRGEEGSMGNPNASGGRYAVVGPLDNPDPHASRITAQMPERRAVMRMSGGAPAGRLPPEVIQRVVRQGMGKFRACFEADTRSNPPPSQAVAVKFTIRRDGTVGDIKPSSDIVPPSTQACVAREFATLTFPQPEGGVVKVTYPIQFGI